MDKLANANSQFALDLFQKLTEANPTGNIFFSPLSISSALAMVALGARGNTASELLKTFHFDGVEDLHSVFHTLNTKINRSNAPYILKLANRLYGEKTFNFLSDFLTSTQNLYGAELSTVDFSNAPDKAKKEINQWVEQQTEGKIPELLSEGSINEMTKLVLVNAVYFKGNWAKAFKEEDTEDKPFRLNKAEKKNVKMMFMKEKFPIGFIPECKCRVLELPYKGEDLSMIILLPDSIEDNSTGLEQLEKQLTLEKLQEWTQPKNMNSSVDVYVHLPKFQLEENYDLKSYFAALGLVDLFDSGKADLSGMSGAQDLHVSKIVHKSFLETEKKNVKMMFMKEKLPIGFIPECKCCVLELPYKGEDLSMIILLPDSIEDNSTGLEQLEQQLTLEKLQEWTQPKIMNSSMDVYVHLPKFQLEENYDLKSYFAALGLVDVFESGKADLSGMSRAQDLHMSKIVHKSFLEVNEVGTEAAAATACTFVAYCRPMEKNFKADHPFLFFIRHNPTNMILFLGRFASP